MQLITPQRKDLRLYAMLSDRAFVATDVASLLTYMRNARSHVDKAISDTQVKLNPVMGGVSGTLRLTRVTNINVVPNFTSDALFVKTMLPMICGYDSTGRTNGNNETHSVDDSISPFKFGPLTDGGLVANGTLLSFIPERVGSYNNIPPTTYSLQTSRVYVGSAQGTSYNGEIYQILDKHNKSGRAKSTAIIAAHDSGVGGFYTAINSSITAVADTVMVSWSGNILKSTYGRFDLPTKNSTVLPTVPYANYAINETTVQLAECVIPIAWGPNEFRVIKLARNVDFTGYVSSPGEMPTMTMPRIDLAIPEKLLL